MIFGLMRVISRAPAIKGADPSEVKPTPVHGAVVAIMVVMAAIILCVMWVSGLNNGLIWLFVLISSALIIGSLFIRGASDAWKTLDNRQPIDWSVKPEYTPSQLRERAAIIEQEPTAEPAPAPRPASLPFEWPKREFVSPAKLADDAELQERLLRVAAILVSPCPECNATEAEFCEVVGDDPAYVLDSERKIWAHGRRIGHAIKIGAAKVTDVVAQFDGNEHVPAEVWEEAL